MKIHPDIKECHAEGVVDRFQRSSKVILYVHQISTRYLNKLRHEKYKFPKSKVV